MSMRDLKSYSFYNELTYEERLFVEGLLLKSAPVSVIYLWYNITHGTYTNLPPVVMEKDIKNISQLHPDFKDQIESWTIKN